MKKKVTSDFGLFGWITLGILVVFTILMFLFLGFGLITSVNTRSVYDDKIFFPNGENWVWSFKNYIDVMPLFVIDNELLFDGSIGYANFYSMTINSIVVALGGAFVSVSCYFIVGYATSKFPYFFSKVVYTFVIIAMIIPIIGSAPSVLVILKKTGLYQTLLSEFIMKFNFLGTFFLVFHAAFQGISNEYAEAAQIDGASELTIMLRIMFPLVLPTFTTIMLLRFIENWNDYSYIVLYLKSYPTLAYGVYKMSIEKVNGMEHATMRLASSFLVAIPILIIFVLFRNKIMGNVTMGGVKE